MTKSMKEDEIVYMVKPEWITWDEVQECQVLSHKRNIENGLKMHCTELTGDELKSAIGNGICYVALEGKRVVGTTSLKIKDFHKLWYKKRIGYMFMEAILPEYLGSDVFFGLQDIRMKDVVNNRVDILYFGTAESNKVVRKVQAKLGFKHILYRCFSNNDYYSVIMAKWVRGQALPNWIIKILFSLSEKYVKLRFKPGRIKRFGI